MKFLLRFRGREMAYQNLGREKLMGVCDALKDVAVAEGTPRMEGRMMGILLAPSRKRSSAKPVSKDGAGEGGGCQVGDRARRSRRRPRRRKSGPGGVARHPQSLPALAGCGPGGPRSAAGPPPTADRFRIELVLDRVHARSERSGVSSSSTGTVPCRMMGPWS